jgi:hypothetical protein
VSNYTVVVYATSEMARIDKWLANHSVVTEVFREALTWNRSLLIVSKDVSASVTNRDYFRGTAFNAEVGAVIFGLSGWLEAPEIMRSSAGDHNGEYCTVTWRKHEVQINRDVFGNARLLTTTGPRFAAASDSLIVLASLRKAFNEPVSVNEEVMLARATLNNTAVQQMSPDTMFREISFVPAGYGVTLDTKFDATLTGEPMASRLIDKTDGAYRDRVRNIAEQISRTVAGLASVPGWSSMLSLSGGYDSRVVFGAARATGSLGVFNYTASNKSPLYARDFEVATSLAQQFQMPRITNPRFVRDDHPEDKLTLWAASLLGVYDGFGPNRTTRGNHNTFTLTGIGAELLKGNWGWHPFDELVKGFEEGEVRDAYERQGRHGILSIGGDPSSEFASEVYYIGYRNGLHSAAGHVGVHMTGMHPLQQFALAQLGHTVTDAGHAGNPASIADISVLIDPEVATFPYDDSKRDITQSHASERLHALGGVIESSKLDALTVYGDPSDVPVGPANLGMSIARAIGVTGQFEKETVLRLGREGLALLSPDLRASYEPLIANAEWRIEKVDGDVASAGGSTARLASLTALQLV